MVKIIIVDDHLIVREGIRLILETQDGYEVIGEAENGQQALVLLETKIPDVILLDLNMPILDGLNFLKKFNSLGKGIPVIVLTTYNEQHLLLEAVELGVASYLLKDTGREKLFATIDAALRGETLLQPEMLQLLLRAQAEKHTPKLFTAKELLVLKALARGLKNNEIAEEMNVAERTVKSYLTTIYSKLDVKSRAQAIAVAIDKKYI
ncbi:response regulator transcription factor [Lysinibacillus odysseyi]|uniref:Chemotaxis protein CheY n=1 Tax=Lysinibacillus odysseyi 34hs-1 = NBRC 100172 TaxID=1220589 RepID=A0A0A3II72_9BACI|nr:response regulator transcription factor [Lysinibacillus odysseyi]KGR84471.1 chemotaxis protein CheY [Lysinibacillus odysseyi 34hs-1 = NBRC 100172]